LSRLIEADAWAIFLKDTQAGHFEMVRALNAAAIPAGPFVDPTDERSPVAAAAREQRLVASRPTLAPAGGVAAEQAVLAAPLLAAHRQIGVVLAARHKPFTQSDARDLEFISRALGLALANAIDYREATRQTLIDDLTRLYNVRYLYESLDTEIRRARRYGSAVSVVFIDLDGFKAVNDVYGHRAGSVTLTEVAQLILASVRESDFVARYGVRAQIAGHCFTGGVGAEIHLTASFGVASYPEHAQTAERLIELADAAMYEAKQRRKDSVQVATSS
jgi:GGDEF domain-containing protein